MKKILFATFFLSLFVFGLNSDRIGFYLNKIVSLSPHPSGSKNIRALRKFIASQLKKDGISVSFDPFVANTPIGKIKMCNVIGEKKGTTDKILILASHYDSKLFKKFKFIGANDSGSSTAALLYLADVISRKKDNYFTYRFIFFDGEEAIGRDITDRDGLYGSKHYAKKLERDGEIGRVVSFILLDMIGDKDLNISPDLYSSSILRDMFIKCARERGYPEIISSPMYVVDDHTPFLKMGVMAIDIIDFNYGPGNKYWHTKEDNMKHVSINSIYIVSDCTLCLIKKIEDNLR